MDCLNWLPGISESVGFDVPRRHVTRFPKNPRGGRFLVNHRLDNRKGNEMERILTAVDGSDHAGRAIDLAADLARRYDASLWVLNVRSHQGSGRVPPELEEYERLENLYLSELGLLETAATRVAEDAADRARQAGAQKVEARVDAGDPAATIVRVASELDTDLIVLGRRGLGDIGGLFLGSVSHKVSHLAECAVMTVR